MTSLALNIGTSGDDVLGGTAGTDILLGGNGNDVIDGGDGNDLLLGGNGSDTMDGGSGNDLLFGGNGSDTLDGGSGNDLLDGGNGNDILDGGEGNDLLLGGNGNDILDGGAGSDIVLGGNGDDTLNYTVSENLGSSDFYDGGKNLDTLQLTLTSAELQLAQKDIAAFQAFLTSGAKYFQFQSFNLTVANFEYLKIVEIVTNAKPVALDDVHTANEDRPTAGNVLANDKDLEDGKPVSVSSVNGEAVNVNAMITLASGALLTVNEDGSFTYDANGKFEYLGDGETGHDSFTYTALDAAGAESNTATVIIDVAGANDAPVAKADAFATDEDTATSSGNLLKNDTDAENGQPTKVSAVNGSADNVGKTIELKSGALLIVNADGSFNYDPNGKFEHLGNGEDATDSFTYVASDSQGAASEPATVKFSITGMDDKPAFIQVAVVGADGTILKATKDQLEDSSVFKFAATALLVTDYTDWTHAFDGFDAVVIGDSGFDFAYTQDLQMFSALKAFVDLGGGVVSTGVFAKAIFSTGYGGAGSDADYITPVAASTSGEFLHVKPGSLIKIDAADEAGKFIAGGVTEYTAQGYHEVALAVDRTADTTATVLAKDIAGNVAIAYDELGSGRTVYLGSVHMGADSMFGGDKTRVEDSAVDQIFERAVAWAAGGGTAPAAAAAPSLEVVAAVEVVDQFDFDALAATDPLGTDADAIDLEFTLAKVESDAAQPVDTADIVPAAPDYADSDAYPVVVATADADLL